MSYSNQELETISNFQADFDTFVSQRNWDDAETLIDNMGDLGYETEAMILHRAYNKARNFPKNWKDMTEAEKKEWARDENLREDLANVEDSRDVADRSYPNE